MAQTVKGSAYTVEDPGSIPGVGRSPGEGNGSPLQYSCLENPMDREAWQEPVNTTLVGKRDFPDVIKLRVLRWGDYSR